MDRVDSCLNWGYFLVSNHCRFKDNSLVVRASAMEMWFMYEMMIIYYVIYYCPTAIIWLKLADTAMEVAIHI